MSQHRETDARLPWTAEEFRLALEASPTAMIMTDQTGQIVLANGHAEDLLGYARGELLGLPVEALVPARSRARHPEFRVSFSAAPQARRMGEGRDLHARRKDGSEVPVEIGLKPLETAQGRFVLSSIVDITERKRAERERERLLSELQRFNAELEQRVAARTAELTKALSEREVLLQEIHHRVKNNLQIISSLVNMQARKLEGSAGRDALVECQTRIHAIALIHEQLYQTFDYECVPLAQYARSLAASVFNAVGASPERIELQFDLAELSLTVHQAIPCGLLLNELLTNALKHAFPDGRPGFVRVELEARPHDNVRFAVVDNGVGLPENLDASTASSLGLQLISTLAEQLHGELSIQSGAETRFELTFRAEATRRE